MLESKEERHVVDAGHGVIDLVEGHADVVAQVFGGEGHAVAKTHCGDLRATVESPAIHGHGVGIVDVQRVGAEPLHVCCDVEQNGNSANAPHDATDPERVGDGLTQAVCCRDLEVENGARPVPGDLNHGDDVVGAVECPGSVGGGRDGGRGAQRPGHSMGDHFRRCQTFGVDVEQGDARAGQVGVPQHVAQEILGEHGAPSPHEHDLGRVRGSRGAVHGRLSERRTGAPILA